MRQRRYSCAIMCRAGGMRGARSTHLTFVSDRKNVCLFAIYSGQPAHRFALSFFCAAVAGCLSGAELKSRTAKKSVKLIVSVLRCSHSLFLLLAHYGDHGMAIPISSRRSIAPGRSMSLSCGAAAWPVRVTDDCDTKPAKVLNCLYSATAAAAAIDEWVSIYPSCPPASLPQDEERD